MDFEYFKGEKEYGITRWGAYSESGENVPDYIREVYEKIIYINAYSEFDKAVDELCGENVDKSFYDMIIEPPETDKKALFDDIIRNNNFAKYIEYSNEIIRNDTAITDSEKKLLLEGNDLLLEAFSKDLSKAQWSQIYQSISSITNLKIALETGEYNLEKLTEEDRTNLEQQIAEMELGVANGAVGYGAELDSTQPFINETIILSLGLSVAQILLIVMGALLIAEEIQSGSIKALIIAPVKRHRIFTAKFMTLLTAWALETVLVFVAFVISNTIFGFGSAPMVFTFLGKAVVLNYYVYYFIYIVLAMVDALVFGIFALMMSTLLRNAGAAISLSLVITLVINSLVTEIAQLITKQVPAMVCRFLPAVNLQIQSRVLATAVENDMDILSALFGGSPFTKIPWTFSAVYIVVLSGIMLFIGYQSFKKRDIK